MDQDKDLHNDDWAEGYADATCRLIGIALGSLDVLKGRRDALEQVLLRLNSTIVDVEHKQRFST